MSWAKGEGVREVTVYELAVEYRAVKGSEATPGPPRSRNFKHGVRAGSAGEDFLREGVVERLGRSSMGWNGERRRPSYHERSR